MTRLNSCFGRARDDMSPRGFHSYATFLCITVIIWSYVCGAIYLISNLIYGPVHLITGSIMIPFDIVNLNVGNAYDLSS